MKWWISLILVLSIAGCGGEQQSDQQVEAGSVPLQLEGLYGAVITPPRAIPDFSLDSTTGETFTLSDHAGKVVLLYFGYMTCPDVCPSTMADLMRVYRTFEDPSENITVVFVTVDPERDTLDRLEKYMSAFHEDFIGLRTEDAAVLQAILDSFGAQATRQEVDSSLGYLMDHTASVFLVGPDGKLWEQFLFGTSYADIANDVEFIIKN